jgi:hypothetical protein
MHTQTNITNIIFTWVHNTNNTKNLVQIWIWNSFESFQDKSYSKLLTNSDTINFSLWCHATNKIVPLNATSTRLVAVYRYTDNYRFFINTDYSILKFSIYRNIDIFRYYWYHVYVCIFKRHIKAFSSADWSYFRRTKTINVLKSVNSG